MVEFRAKYAILIIVVVLLTGCSKSEISTTLTSAVKVESTQVVEKDKYVVDSYAQELKTYLNTVDRQCSILLGSGNIVTTDITTFKNDYRVTDITIVEEVFDNFTVLTTKEQNIETKSRKVNYYLSSLWKVKNILTEIVIDYNGCSLRLSSVPYRYEDYSIKTKNGDIINEGAKIDTLFLNANASFSKNQDGSFSYYVYYENCSLCITAANRSPIEEFINEEIN